MKKIYYIILFVATFSFLSNTVEGQNKDYSKMTKEEVMQMSYDELLELPFEDLLSLAEVVGVSADELLQMILNQDVKSASKKKEKNFDSPLSSSVVTYDEIKASGATCIAEALRLVPGLIVREKTNGNFDVHIRGNDNIPNNHMLVYSENSMTLVMIDGRPVYNYVNGGTFWETLPVGLEDIERIEVVRGPSSALYGPNAVSGVINIITRNVDTDELKVFADAQAGTMGTAIGNISASKGFGKLKMRFSGNYEYRDRQTDDFYVMALDDYFTLDEYDNLSYVGDDGNTYDILDPTDSVDELFPNPGTAMDRFGINGFFNYKISNELDFNLATGTQNSSVITTQLGDAPVALSTRESNTQYVDFRSNVYGFKPQVSYLFGWQNLVRGDEGFKIDMYTLNANLEYDFNYKNLNIRPGVFYQEYMADDTPYLSGEGNGIINGEITTSLSAASLRLDYIAFNKLRLIAAVRGEQYTYPEDETYLTYQFVGSYKINDNNIVRAVHSRANRGPFGMDTYSNYLWTRQNRPDPGYIYFNGNKDMDLVVMDMFEVGYRTKPMKNILVDLELFTTSAEGFGALYPDSVHLFYDNNFPPPMGVGRPYARLTFQNNDIVSKQTGGSMAISWVPREDLAFKIHGTYQQTKLENVIPYNNSEILGMMFADAYMNGLIDLNGDGIPEDFNGDGIPDPYPTNYIDLNGDGNPDDLNGDGVPDIVPSTPYSTNVPDSTVNEMDHEATPSYYGGFSINYLPLQKKLNIYTSAYFYGEQTFVSQYGEYKIDPKVILNTKIAYKFYKEHQVYFNARNLLSDDKKEFGLGDQTGGIYMLGLSLAF